MRKAAFAAMLTLAVVAASRPAAGQEAACARDGGVEAALACAAALRAEGKAAEAEARLRPLYAADPEDPRVLAALAEAIADQDRAAEAAHLYLHVLALTPSDETARTRAAVLLTYAGRLEDALSHYRSLLAAHPNDPTLNLAAADLLVNLDRAKEALPYYEAYLAVVPNDTEALRQVYRIHLWSGENEKALRVLERLARDLDVDALAGLAGSYEEHGREGDAIATWERVLAANPGNLAALKALGRLYEWNDQPEKALDRYQAYLAIRPDDDEVRARAVGIAVDLGYGGVARGHARLLGVGSAGWRDLATEAAFLEGMPGSSAGVRYNWFTNNHDFSHHEVGPDGRFGIGRKLALGAFYRFHHLSGPGSDGVDATILGHEGGVLLDAALPWRLRLDGSASVTGYDSDWVSVNGHLQFGRTFGPVTVLLRAERKDVLLTLGAVQDEVYASGGALRIYAEPWWRLFMTGAFEYHLYSDANHRLYGDAAAGIVALDLPRIEVSYTYSIEHFTDSAKQVSYFNPARYQTHGPMVAIQHPVTPWFRYGADLRLWHAVRDDVLMLTYGAEVAFRIAQQHLIRAAYHRTDTVVGTTLSLYQENLLSASYVFEF